MIPVPGIGDIHSSCPAFFTVFAGIVFPAAFIAKICNLRGIYHTDRQFQMGTVVILVIYKPGLCNIDRLVIFSAKSGLFISGPSFDPHRLCVFQKRNLKDRKRDFDLVDRR